jgi:hypothetical protein
MLFSDSETGAPHGYVDGWKNADRFDYTGEGQRGDQRMRGGNLQILRHEQDGRALRLFEGSGGVVKYVGEFYLDKSDPYELVDAPESGGGPIRAAILFHLRPAENTPRPNLPEAVPRRVLVERVPIEERFTERFAVDPNREPRESERRESRLVQDFKTYLEAKGHELYRNMIRLPDAAQPLFTDLFIEDLAILVEAKGTLARAAFRSAIGQLADYRRFIGNPDAAILLPSAPTRDLLDLADSLDLSVYWQTEDEEFRFHGRGWQ